MEIISLLWIYSPVTSNRCFTPNHIKAWRTLVTEPHVGCSKDQIAQAVLDTELDTNRLFVIQSALTSWWSAPLCRSERQR